MKKILKDTCILAALMILSVFAVSVIWSGITEEIGLVLKLFLLAFILSVTNYFFDEYIYLSIVMTYVVKYLAITGLVMLFGFISGWFYPSNFWMVFIYVGIIAVLLYFLDFIRTEKDIRAINEMVRLSRDQKPENNSDVKE